MPRLFCKSRVSWIWRANPPDTPASLGPTTVGDPAGNLRLLCRVVRRSDPEFPGQKALGIQGAGGVDVAHLLVMPCQACASSLILVQQLLLMLVSAAEQKAFAPQHSAFCCGRWCPGFPKICWTVLNR